MKKALFCMLLLVACSGCLRTRYIRLPERYPVYEMPEKAKLAVVSEEELKVLPEATQKKIIDTVTNLKIEATRLRATLETYNNYAKFKNKDYDEYVKQK